MFFGTLKHMRQKITTTLRIIKGKEGNVIEEDNIMKRWNNQRTIGRKEIPKISRNFTRNTVKKGGRNKFTGNK